VAFYMSLVPMAAILLLLYGLKRETDKVHPA
jgi:hypothetical protein